MKRFIVTGGAGLIGSNVVKALNNRGWREIIVVDHLNHPAKRENLAQLKYTEYMDKADFRKQMKERRIPAVDCVFHLGACSSTLQTDEAYLHDNNFQYTQELCEWSIKNGTRFVYASSAATYGDGSCGYCDDDAVTKKLIPLNPYGRSKQEFDLWAMSGGVLDKIAGLKYFNVYGPGEDHKGEMQSLIRKSYDRINQTGEITLFKSHRPDYTDGMQQRDFVYVEDAVNVTLFFYDHPEISGLFNCGTGCARTWIDLANALFAAMNRPSKIRFVDMPQSIRDKYQYHTQADMTKLRRAGYTAPFAGIEEGVRKYVQEYLQIQKKVV